LFWTKTSALLIFPENFEEKIGFDRIRESVAKGCMTEAASDLLAEEGFLTDPKEIRIKLSRVKEITRMRDEEDFVIEAYADLRNPLAKLKVAGSFLDVLELADLRKNLNSARAILNFFKKTGRSEMYPSINTMCGPVKVYPFILERIDRVLSKQGTVRDQASRDLARIRSSLASLEKKASVMLQSILKKVQKDGMAESDTNITHRNGRPVIPLPAGKKRQLTGIIHDESASGKTVFVEPSEVVGINNEIRELGYAEQREIISILKELTKDLQPYAEELGELAGFLAAIDLVQSKAKYAKSILAVIPEVVDSQVIEWKKAMHPLLYLALKKEKRKLVPLDMSLNSKSRILLISGPNAGGKSVCLKTVGLLQYMVQCGFPVPMHEDSKVGVFRQIFIDIGDEQSIENDLSTYSSHLMNMKYFSKHAGENTLLLIDEFGTGTEPSLGGAIAEAILGRLNELKAWGVITTHYSNLKHFAADADGIENGAMLFDTGAMQPLYRLEIGQPGSSFAFEIARNIGLSEEVIRSASEKVGEGHIQFDKHLREIIRDKKYWESKRDKIRIAEKKLQETLGNYTRELELTESTRKEIISKARAEAETLLGEANRKIEKTIWQIRESQAEKEKTKKAREDLQSFREESTSRKAKEKEELEKRVEKLKNEEKKVKLRRQKFGQAEPSVKSSIKPIDPTIRAGDFVLMKGQEIPGEVLEIKGSKLSVRFGHLTTRVEEGKLEKITEEKFRNHEKPAASRGDYADWDIAGRKMQFRPEIDLRGQKADEALRNVVALIDEAIMVECRDLRILHGKGDGILRQVIRQYLESMDVVKSAGDEHLDLGGAGVTIVILDI
jgi:DNA mismatch repair protein MutS2